MLAGSSIGEDEEEDEPEPEQADGYAQNPTGHKESGSFSPPMNSITAGIRACKTAAINM